MILTTRIIEIHVEEFLTAAKNRNVAVSHVGDGCVILTGEPTDLADLIGLAAHESEDYPTWMAHGRATYALRDIIRKLTESN